MPENFVKGKTPAKQDDWFTQGCVKSDGTRSVALQLKESAPALWARYTDKWVADANVGRHTYGRYAWNVLGSQPCPSPSPTPSPSPSPSPTPIAPTPRNTATPVPFPTAVLPSGVTLPPTPTRSPARTP
jgi:hypothetical protein